MTATPTFVGYIAMSLDGFIATTDGGVAWLDPFNALLGEDAGGYGDFIADIDALVMGRTTHEQVMGWGWPYETRAGYVLTRQQDFTGDHVAGAGPIETLRTQIEGAGHQRVWIMGGGQTQRAALDAGMFDSLSVFVMPVLLGDGLPCFTSGRQHNLSLDTSTPLPGGILKLDYTIKD